MAIIKINQEQWLNLPHLVTELDSSFWRAQLNQEPLDFEVEEKWLGRELKNLAKIEEKSDLIAQAEKIKAKMLTVKTNNVNDLNLNRWWQYGDILTTSWWEINERAKDSGHDGSYHGNYVPQIPNQFIRRFSRENDLIIDPFLGSGTTLIEAAKLKRSALGVDIQSEMVARVNTKIQELNLNQVIAHTGNSQFVNWSELIAQYWPDRKQADLIFYHPPYWNMIEFSQLEGDISNLKKLDQFLSAWQEITQNLDTILKPGGYVVMVMGDMYKNGEWIPLHFRSMEVLLALGYQLKSIIVKNMGETKAKQGQEQLWRYRALTNGFYVFKHEYISLYQKI